MMLSVDKLSCRFGDLLVLNEVTFSLCEGQATGLIGPNGSGKTTLFNCLSGFAPLSGGRILLAEQEIGALAPFERAHRGVGRVFQQFGVFRELSVIDNVLLAIESKAGYRAFISWGSAARSRHDRAMQCLERVGLADKAHENASVLSGGQLRLLEIARLVAQDAKLLLVDEPTAGVSPKMRAVIAGALRELIAEGRTVFIIEHDLAFIQQLCDRVLVLNTGRLVIDDTPAKVRNSPILQQIYFG